MNVKKISHSMIVLFFCCFLCLAVSLPVHASSTSGSKADAIGTSLYDVSTALTAYVNRVLSPNSNEKHTGNKVTETNGKNVGNSGAFVGYGDVDKDFVAFVISNMSGSTSTSTYDAWVGMEKTSKNTIYGYCRYGYLLSDLGLDKTAPMTTGVTQRMIFGGLMYAVYVLCSFVSQIFYFAFMILRILNPFQFFTLAKGTHAVAISGGGVRAVGGGLTSNAGESWSRGYGISRFWRNGLPQIGENWPAGLSGVRNAFKTVAEAISEMYEWVNGLSWSVVIPFFFVLLVASLLLLNNGNKMNKVIVFIKRILFIGLGIPVLGILYTASLDKVIEENMQGNNVAATSMVASTFVDFQSWASNGRLAPTSGATLVSIGMGDDASTAAGGASEDAIRSVRKTTWNINNKSGVLGTDAVRPSFAGSSSYDMNVGIYDNNGTLKTDSSSDSTKKRVLDVISRYMNGTFYQASDWESSVNKTLNSKYSSEMGSSLSTPDAHSNDATIHKMFDETDEVDDWIDREAADNNAIFDGTNTSKIKWGTKGFNIFCDGNLTSNNLTANNNVTKTKLTYTGTWPSSATDPASRGGLSIVSMYNYLSSSFSPSSITTYSAEQSPSEFVKQAHYSVNLVGSGILSMCIGANCIVMLGVLSLVGIIYAIHMMISVLKRGFSLIVAVPGAMVGVLKQITQMIVYVIMMIAELVGTAFMYSFIGDLLVLFATVSESLTRTLVDGTSTTILGGYFGASGLYLDVNMVSNGLYSFYANLILTSVVIIMFGIVLYKCRCQILSVLECVSIVLFKIATFEDMREYFDEWVVSYNHSQHKTVGFDMLRPVFYVKQVCLKEV